MLKFITNTFQKLFGNKADRDVKAVTPLVNQINEEFDKLSDLSFDDLRNKTLEFKERIGTHLAGIDEDIKTLEKQAETETDIIAKDGYFEEIDSLKKDRDKHLEDILLDILPEAFAVVKETAKRFTNNTSIKVKATQHDRDLAVNKNYITIEGDHAIWANSWDAAGAEVTWNMIHYDVQLIGGITLHQGKVAEMATGEGKTLVATLPAYLNGLSGLGTHVITVNDYLARRDCQWVGPIFEFLFLTVDCIDFYKPHSAGRKAAYNCDITYGTNNEFGFDYLRDNMVRSMDEMVQKKHHYVMIDEVDSVLIDEARTPLIISGPIPKGGQDQEYAALKPHIQALLGVQKKLVAKYLAEAKKMIKEGNVGPNEGEGGLSLFRAFRGLPKSRSLTKYVSEQGVKSIKEKTENFYLQEQAKHMPDADAPLYFIIDEKNNVVELTEKGSDFLSNLVGSKEDANFFVVPDIPSTLIEIEASDLTEEEQQAEKDKLIRDYGQKAQRLHSTNQLLKAYALFEKDDQYLVVNGKVLIVDEQTGRTMEGRRYSDGLHQAIEAKEDVKIEAATQTYATVTLQNYFRMYHKLAGMTGTAETEAKELWDIYKLDVVVIPTNRPIARFDQEDLVYKTEKDKYNAAIAEIIKQSQAGRPVLVGTTSVEISERLSAILDMRNIKHNVLNAKQHEREAIIVAEAGQAGVVTIATNMAGRGTDIKLGEGVKEAGGLAIVGTERHDSRRVDRQLRGRSGRQGDPGSSQFFVSMEDKLMRLFHSERITKLMDKMGYEEGEVIQHSMVSKSIERAQKRVEENSFGVRKRLLEYDDVMNIQREAIYKKRYNALSGERLSVDLHYMFIHLAEDVIASHREFGTYESFKEDALLTFGFEPEFEEAQFKDGNIDNLIEEYKSQVSEYYNKKKEAIRHTVMPTIRQVHLNQGDRYRFIAIPFTDGRQQLDLRVHLEDAINSEGATILDEIEKGITLGLIDQKWKEHLRSMDELKESTQSASFEQKDPLVIYKIEAYKLFEEFVGMVNREVVSFLTRGIIPLERQEDVQEARQQRRASSDETTTNKEQEEAAAKAAAAGAGQQRSKPVTVRREKPKISRNAPCPCGSGKKYKQCHGRG